MSTGELASADFELIKKKIVAEAIDDCRLDWYDEHKKEILESNGIDPNNTWNYDEDDDSGSEPEIDD